MTCGSGKPARRRALLDGRLDTQFLELERLGRLLDETQRWAPIVCLSGAPPLVEGRMLSRCAELGWPVTRFPGRVRPTRALEHLPAGVGRTCSYVLDLREDLASADRLIEREAPALVVVAEDGMGANRALIAAARRRGLPTLIVPYEYSTITQPLNAIRAQPGWRGEWGMESAANRLAARLFPHWLTRDAGELVLRANGCQILAEELLGASPRQPWSVHGGRADRLLVESARMRRHYVSEGIAETKLASTGALWLDALARSRASRDEVRRGLGLAPADLAILCSIPPDYAGSGRAEFSTYEELLRFWVESLEGVAGPRVVYQLHPALSTEQAARVEALGARVARANIAELLPAFDLFVTSVSSVIRFAIVCGIPVLNYDVYRFGYSDYQDAGGVTTVSDRTSFRTALLRLATDGESLREAHARQLACATDWGDLDGRGGERILGEIDGLLASSPANVTSRERGGSGRQPSSS